MRYTVKENLKFYRLFIYSVMPLIYYTVKKRSNVINQQNKEGFREKKCVKRKFDSLLVWRKTSNLGNFPGNISDPPVAPFLHDILFLSCVVPNQNRRDDLLLLCSGDQFLITKHHGGFGTPFPGARGPPVQGGCVR